MNALWIWFSILCIAIMTWPESKRFTLQFLLCQLKLLDSRCILSFPKAYARCVFEESDTPGGPALTSWAFDDQWVQLHSCKAEQLSGNTRQLMLSGLCTQSTTFLCALDYCYSANLFQKHQSTKSIRVHCNITSPTPWLKGMWISSCSSVSDSR